MRILFAASEMAPWVKTGGLGDVVAALPPALMRLGMDVKVLLPAYPGLTNDFPNAAVVARIAAPGGELPAAVLREAHTPQGVGLLMIDCPALYARAGNPYLGADGRDWPDNVLRFGLLSRVAALLASAATPLAWHPEILHCHDWQSALALAYLHYLHPLHPHHRRAGTLLTVHNLAFQGKFARESLKTLGLPEAAWSMDGVEFYNELSFLKAGVQFADWITTVSPTYAREIQTDAEGMGMAGLLRSKADRLSGILNGIDETVWNPAADPLLPAHYGANDLAGKAANKRALQQRLKLDARDDLMLFGVVSRLAHQKGLDLVLEAADTLLQLPAQLAILGSGEAALETAFAALARRHPGRVAATIGFDEGLAHLIEGGADCFLMPSRFEPCGLNQMYSLTYGTPPVVRATGGLADTVIDLPGHADGDTTTGAVADAATSAATSATTSAATAGRANGFVFHDATAPALAQAIRRAHAAWRNPPLWRQLQDNGMRAAFHWGAPAAQYAEVYGRIRRPAP